MYSLFNKAYKYTPVVKLLRRMGQNNTEFKASQDNIMGISFLMS